MSALESGAVSVTTETTERRTIAISPTLDLSVVKHSAREGWTASIVRRLPSHRVQILCSVDGCASIVAAESGALAELDRLRGELDVALPRGER